MGYHLAGFDVVGVDIAPRRRYPFEFVLGDAVEYVTEHGHLFDAIHASPPCQAHSQAQRIASKEHPDLIWPTRRALRDTGKPYVIENVVGAPLIDPILLCGAMFEGLRTYRHRLFESNVKIAAPDHPEHVAKQNHMGRRVQPGEFMHVVGNFIGVDDAREAMGISWMSRRELAEAIPPEYTKHIGNQLLTEIHRRNAA
ncbi:DNA methylase [Nocardiaceae bacterium NPDC056970]